MNLPQVGERIEFYGSNFDVTQIVSRAKDGSRRVILQEVLPLDGVGEDKQSSLI